MVSSTTVRRLALLSAFGLVAFEGACSQKSSGSNHSSFAGASAVVTTSPTTTDPNATTTTLATTTTAAPATTVPAGSASGSGTEEASASGEAAADELTAADLSVNKLYTNGSSTAETCVNVSFVAKKAGTPVEGIFVGFATVISTAGATDGGRVSPAEAKTDANGLATTSYCSGLQAVTLTVSGRVGALSTNSAEIKVTPKPVYALTYLRYDGQEEAAAAGGGAASGSGSTVAQADTIRLNLLDAGPRDCTKLYFKLEKDATPVASAELTFRTQLDYPKGSKLAEKAATATNGTDTATGKKYATFTATSSGQGEFAVPVCAGVDLGTIVVSGAFTDEDKKVYTAKSPVIAIDAGLTNYANVSLTYDAKNAKIIRGQYNSNTGDVHPFTVKLGARQDGQAITDYPIQVVSEMGKLTVDNNGYPGADGTVKFTMEALHLSSDRPYPVVKYSSTDAQIYCNADALAAEGSPVLYSVLRRNWRSTIVYMVRGQEHFNDTNHNGVFDENKGDGFWDVNQNGVYDEFVDVLTFDWKGDHQFDPTSEWFIDLPTPFVDVDENGQYDAGRDIVIGDVYSPPNGKRDNDTLIWKSDVVPIYLGTSPFAATHGQILANLGPDSIADAYFSDLKTRGLLNIPTPIVYGTASRLKELFGGGATSRPWARTTNVVKVTQTAHGLNVGDVIYVNGSSGAAPLLNVPSKAFVVTVANANDFSFADSRADDSGTLDWSKQDSMDYGESWRYIYAHDVCGNPPPGDTKIEAKFIDDVPPTYGVRAFQANFYIQPGDQILEPARRLLSDGDGGPVAHVNFNVSDHKSNANSFPVAFRLAVAPCSNACTGAAIVVPGYACGRHSAHVQLTLDGDTNTTLIDVPAVSTCMCDNSANGGGLPINGVCDCPTGTVWTPATNNCDVPPT